MRGRTEDLLTLRDGEPIDVAVRDALLADAASRAEVERLAAVRDALRALPVLEPSAGVWQRVATLTAETGPRAAWPMRRLFAGAAVALGVALAALWLVAREPPSPDAGPAPVTTVVDQPPARRPAVDLAPQAPLVPPSYVSLVEQSARLERLLAQVRERQRPVMSGGTASTIAGLEDRITMIDEQLSLAAATNMRPEERQALWRERVDLMNALVYVRMAQSERGGF